MHLIIDEAIVSELPDLLPLMLQAWPRASAMVSSAAFSKCLDALDNRSADAAIVRLQGIEASEIGKLTALPLATSLEGTMILYVEGKLAETFARLAELAQSHQQTIEWTNEQAHPRERRQ